MHTVNDMISQGYALTTVAGRKVLALYFPEYDETFLCPANVTRGQWNTGNAFDSWLIALDNQFATRVFSVSTYRVSITGRI